MIRDEVMRYRFGGERLTMRHQSFLTRGAVDLRENMEMRRTTWIKKAGDESSIAHPNHATATLANAATTTTTLGHGRLPLRRSRQFLEDFEISTNSQPLSQPDLQEVNLIEHLKR